MTPQLKKEVMRFERYKRQFAFLEDKGIKSQEELLGLKASVEEKLDELLKERTLLNVIKKRRQPVYAALADLAVYAEARNLYLAGQEGFEAEYAKYAEAEALLDKQPKSQRQLTLEKAQIYNAVAEINREIHSLRQELTLCEEVKKKLPQISRTIEKVEQRKIENQRESEVR